MQRLYPALFLIFLLPFTVFAQGGGTRVVGSAGDHFARAGVGDLHFTLGEVAVARTDHGFILERGFHQGLSTEGSTGLWTAPGTDFPLEVYPNPAKDQLTVGGDWEPGDRLLLRDLLGRQLAALRVASRPATVDLSHLAPGSYFLTVIRNGRPLAGARFVRSR